MGDLSRSHSVNEVPASGHAGTGKTTCQNLGQTREIGDDVEAALATATGPAKAANPTSSKIRMTSLCRVTSRSCSMKEGWITWLPWKTTAAMSSFSASTRSTSVMSYGRTIMVSRTCWGMPLLGLSAAAPTKGPSAQPWKAWSNFTILVLP